MKQRNCTILGLWLVYIGSCFSSIFLVVASELVALSRLFSTICPPELNNGVCMVDNGVGITKEHYWRLLGGDGGVVHCGVVWCGVVW